MIKIDAHTKGVFIAGLLAWILTIGGSWITFTNTVTKLETNQKTILTENENFKTELRLISEHVAENTTHVAVTTSVLNRLNNTLSKIDSSLNVIVNETTRNSARLDAIENK